jgi:hypothetical protein
MGRFIKTFSFVILAVLLIVSCSDLAMFTPPVEKSAGIKVLSLSDGDFLRGGDSVDFMIKSEEQSSDPEVLEITLNAQSGENVWEEQIQSPLTDEKLELILPELDSGLYTIKFSVRSEDGAVEEKQLSFFYVSGQYDILGISSYPPTITAGYETVLAGEFVYPAGSDPYLRWTQDGKVLARGRVSAARDRIAWSAPEEEGVYSIKVELFPFPPPAGTDFPFASSVALTARLYVSSKSFMTEDELVPEGSYYSLFHLNGSLEDRGARVPQGQTREARLTGGARLTDQNGTMGYDLSGDGGIVYPYSVLPLADGRLQPCTLTMKIVSNGENAGKNLLAITSADEAFSFRLSFDKEEQLQATLEHRGNRVLMSSNIGGLETGRIHRLDLSLIPGESDLQALWFHDGLQSSFESSAAAPAGLPAEAQTVLGGEGGFDGIVTELGVYYRDERGRPAVNPEIYREVMKRKYGRLLVLAEGFEGMYLPDPDSWKVQHGEAYLSGGKLFLDAASGITLPFFEPGRIQTALTVEFFGEIPQGSLVALQWEDTEAPFLTVDPTGRLYSEGQTQAPKSFPAPGSSLKLILSSGSLTVLGADGPVTVPFIKPSNPNTWLSVTLGSPEGEGELKVDAILIAYAPGP